LNGEWLTVWHKILLIFILLLAFGLRVIGLTAVPPGLTHDEANHGWDSMNILDGELRYYFPLNYGSEPLYNYVVAGNMALMGENLFALRLVNVFFGLLTAAAAYAWARQAFGRRTGLVAAGLLAVSFWPLATSRQALRAGILPFLTVMAIVFFWQLVYRRRKDGRFLAVGFAVAIAAMLHTYLAARVLWLIFPLFLGYLAFVHRERFRASWPAVVVGLAAGFGLTVPMFLYIQRHPWADTRLEMLDGPLQNLLSGNLGPVLENAGKAFLAFFWPGYGDQFLAYNIPGRPVLDPVTAVFFLIGLTVCLWRWRRPAFALLLLWFWVGILPSLITGPTANTTRNMGALAAAYLLPAVGFVAAGQWLQERWPPPRRWLLSGTAALWLLVVLLLTTRDYFQRWAESPDVRAAYQHTLAEALAYLDEEGLERPVVISSVYPGAAHDPSVARVLLGTNDLQSRWIDGRYGLIFPQGADAWLLAPAATPLHQAFEAFVELVTTISLETDDLDPAFRLYRLKMGAELSEWLQVDGQANFGGAILLQGARWLGETAQPGETVELMSLWQVLDPAMIGPVVPPAFRTDVVFFTHVLKADGTILAQGDRLDVPSWDWQPGDLILQIHSITIPSETVPGEYQVIVGIYDRQSGERPQLFIDNVVAGDRAFVVPLEIDGNEARSE
jgi:4-amino-4-deoxy-L-arabinose transferase-like glycosyltransferase